MKLASSARAIEWRQALPAVTLDALGCLVDKELGEILESPVSIMGLADAIDLDIALGLIVPLAGAAVLFPALVLLIGPPAPLLALVMLAGLGWHLRRGALSRLRRLAYLARLPGLQHQLKVAGGWLAEWL